MTDKVKIYHKNQNVFESYIFQFGNWQYVTSDVSDEWKPNEYDFHELIHSQNKNADGHYGRYIKV